ncbi:MAG: anti-sigma factor antagonist [Lachnospiraceae bacterium]|nr:anti-sigma factor antagonist [Lachnospiraceae bacterium]
MHKVAAALKGDHLELKLSGRVDSNNSRQAEEDIMELVSSAPGMPVVLDLEELEYISSAGLRVLLHLRKTNPSLRLTNVSSNIYEILEMTGFTQMMPVEKAYRVVSVEGCEEIGRGANGTIYRIDQDNVVKVYNNADALADIQHEREVARIALVLGIPTAISYDVVRVGESYGSVFELLNARSFSKILANEPDKLDWCVNEYVEMLKKIHGTLVPAGKLPDMRETVVGWAMFMKDHLPEEAGEKLLSMVEAVPHDDHMIHGDYHTKNLELQGDEVLLIDMDTLAVGHPVFELASMYNAFIGFSEYDNNVIKSFQGFDLETSKRFWKKTLEAYLGTEDPERIKEVEDKARIVGYTRLVRRAIRRNALETEKGSAEVALWKQELLELLEKTDTLVF